MTLDDIRHIMFDVEKQKNVRVRQLMHSPPEILLSTENIQLTRGKHEKPRVWNPPVVENNRRLVLVSKAKIGKAYRKKLQCQKEEY